jgi:release factor glutamine methyltransferase
MRSLVRYIVGRTYRPLLVRYLSRTRTFLYKGLLLEIPSEVFHPGFFFTTKILLRYIDGLQVSQKKFLELGCGSGLIAMYAARKGAIVTASDINSVAVDNLLRNSVANNIKLHIIHSDLFQNIPPAKFDVIAINPPYYKKQPATEKEFAWYCGEKGEYFRDLFASLHQYIHQHSEVIMVLSEVCVLELVERYAEANCFLLREVYSTGNWMERNRIYLVQSQT